MNKYYCTKSAADKGSIFQIRTNLNTETSKRMSMIVLTTVCFLACTILGISSLTECPENLVDKDLDSYIKSVRA